MDGIKFSEQTPKYGQHYVGKLKLASSAHFWVSKWVGEDITLGEWKPIHPLQYDMAVGSCNNCRDLWYSL